jgi:hypothetical protein
MLTQISGFLPGFPREVQLGGEANLEGVSVLCGTVMLLNSGVKGKGWFPRCLGNSGEAGQQGRRRNVKVDEEKTNRDASAAEQGVLALPCLVLANPSPSHRLVLS